VARQRGAGHRAAAENAGFEAAFCAEVNNDAVATALLMGLATRRLKVGTGTASTATGKQASPATATDLTINRIIN
jgi:alkanesulfonate monooxygenase SsuD/methylene tetrahydromethanopterin reductase-like flavin-dependent oxidoreductase (luciferase family)